MNSNLQYPERKIYLSSYYPLIQNKAGREAANAFNIPRFVDGSCRREPDFESRFPSISALCHGRNFAPRLLEGDIIVYITHKGPYLGAQEHHWRLTAVLEVFKRFESHVAAARWYVTRGLSRPRNCMVEGNPPLPREKTVARWPIKSWDRFYRMRARQCGVFLACKPRYLELHNPPEITEGMMSQVFKRIPGTRNPPAISLEQFCRLMAQLGLNV